MARRVKIAARAAQQIRSAAEWWLTHRPAAPNAIATDLREALALLAEHPDIGAMYHGARTPGARRLFLGRVGVFVYYKANDEDLRVLAFWRASREYPPIV